MSSINQVILLGFLGRDPELIKKAKNGAFVRLSLATSQSYLNTRGEWEKTTDWHTVYISNKLGDFALSHFKKGEKLFVKGRLHTRMWQDKNDVKHFQTAVYADDLHGFIPFEKSEQETSKQDLDQEGIAQFIAELASESDVVNK